MAIAFTQIPANLLVPGQYQEIDNSLAGESGEIKRVLIVGLKSNTGKAQAGVPVSVLSPSVAGDLFGFGSPASIMAETFLKHNKVESLSVLPIAEPRRGRHGSKPLRLQLLRLLPAVSKFVLTGGRYLQRLMKEAARTK